MQAQKIDLLLHCRWLIPVIPENDILQFHSVAIAAGRIIDLLPTSKARQHYDSSREIELDRHIVMPGLVNAHCQSATRLLRGQSPNLLTEHSAYEENDRLFSDADFVADSNLLATAEMIKTGTTCFVDVSFPHDILLDNLRKSGLRCQIAFRVLNNATPFAASADQYIHQGLSLYDKIGEHPLLQVACAPQKLETLSDAVLKQLSALVNELELPLHIPCHTNNEEIKQSLSQYGCRPINRLNNMGLLSPQARLIDMNEVTTVDIQLLEETNTQLIYCPSTRLKGLVSDGLMERLQQANLTIALGSGEISAGMDLDLLSRVKLCAQMALTDVKNSHPGNSHGALRAATIEGAKALGWDREIGSLEVGKSADIIAFEIDPIVQLPLYNPCQQLVETFTGNQVSHSWVAGQPLMQDSKLLHYNEQTLHNLALNWHNRLAV